MTWYILSTNLAMTLLGEGKTAEMVLQLFLQRGTISLNGSLPRNEVSWICSIKALTHWLYPRKCERIRASSAIF